MDKNGNITISYDTWKSGIQTPLTGMGDIVNIDIFDEPGVAKIAHAPTALATTNFTGTPVFGVVEPRTNNVLLGDFDGELYTYSISSGTLTAEADGASGMNDGVWWQDYLIVTDRTTTSVKLNAYNGTSWTNNFKSYTADTNSDGFYTKTHASPADNDLYIGYGRYVARISAIGTFAPGSGGTWSSVDKFLILPKNYVVRDITTFANFLVVSASLSGGGSNDSPFHGGRLYYWDMNQTATATVEFSGFVELNTNTASPLISQDNLMYYYKWFSKQIALTNLSSAQDILTMRNHTSSSINDFLYSVKNCGDIVNDYIVLGLTSEGNATPGGLYHIQGDAYTRNIVSTGEVGDSETLDIRFVTSVGPHQYLVGYKDFVGDGTLVVDHFGKSGYRYTDYKAYLESPLYQVSGSLKKKSYQQVEVSLAKELATGQGVRVSYRKNLTDSFTTIATLDFATYGAQSQFNVPAKITDASTLQFKVELTTGASSTTSPELISVRIF